MNKILFLVLCLVPWLALAQDSSTVTPTSRAGIYTISVTPTIQAAAYAAGDCLHAEAIEIAGATSVLGGAGEVVSVEIGDNAALGKHINVYFFTEEPSTICGAINGAFDPADADLALIRGPIRLTNHEAFNDNGVSLNITDSLSYRAAAGETSIWMALEAAEAMTPASTSDFVVKVTVKRN